MVLLQKFTSLSSLTKIGKRFMNVLNLSIASSYEGERYKLNDVVLVSVCGRCKTISKLTLFSLAVCAYNTMESSRAIICIKQSDSLRTSSTLFGGLLSPVKNRCITEMVKKNRISFNCIRHANKCMLDKQVRCEQCVNQIDLHTFDGFKPIKLKTYSMQLYLYLYVVAPYNLFANLQTILSP